jgi:hypothetical protein
VALGAEPGLAGTMSVREVSFVPGGTAAACNQKAAGTAVQPFTDGAAASNEPELTVQMSTSGVKVRHFMNNLSYLVMTASAGEKSVALDPWCFRKLLIDRIAWRVR